MTIICSVKQRTVSIPFSPDSPRSSNPFSQLPCFPSARGCPSTQFSLTQHGHAPRASSSWLICPPALTQSRPPSAPSSSSAPSPSACFSCRPRTSASGACGAPPAPWSSCARPASFRAARRPGPWSRRSRVARRRTSSSPSAPQSAAAPSSSRPRCSRLPVPWRCGGLLPLIASPDPSVTPRRSLRPRTCRRWCAPAASRACRVRPF